MKKKENALEVDIVKLPLLDVYEVYAKYMKEYFNIKWYQVNKRAKLLAVLEQFHKVALKDLEKLQNTANYIRIYQDKELDVCVNIHHCIMNINGKCISYEFLRAITDRPMLHQPLVMRLGKNDELVFEKFEKVVGNN